MSTYNGTIADVLPPMTCYTRTASVQSWFSYCLNPRRRFSIVAIRSPENITDSYQGFHSRLVPIRSFDSLPWWRGRQGQGVFIMRSRGVAHWATLPVSTLVSTSATMPRCNDATTLISFTRCWTNVGPACRRWPNISPALGECIVFFGCHVDAQWAVVLTETASTQWIETVDPVLI